MTSEIKLKHFRPTEIDGVTYENKGYTDTESLPRHRTNSTDPPPEYPGPGSQEKPVGEKAIELDLMPEEEVHTANGFIKHDTGDESDFEDLDDDDVNSCMRGVQAVQAAIFGFFSKNKKILLYLFIGLLVLLYAAYFAYAMYYHFGDEGSIRLLWVTCVVVFFILLSVISNVCGRSIAVCMRPCRSLASKHTVLISWVIAGLIYLGVLIFLIIDQVVISSKPYNLVSLGGICVYVLLLFIFSSNPGKVRWRPVVWGIALQFLFALLILRTDWGRAAFRWLGDRITEFLAHTDVGSEFVFGSEYVHHYFAFKVIPIIIFFSTAVSVLYYLGVMQFIIRKVSWLMQTAMDTTAAESLNAAGNIFIGQTEAPLLIRPLMPKMTKSELHAVMTGGFATIAGSVMGAYIAMGVPANHLLSASVMSAPAALAMAKLFYPETKKSKTTVDDVKVMEKGPERNLIEAASAGASASIRLVANIVANLIAFLAILGFLNATLTWFGIRVGLKPPEYPYLTFELICSYLLFPFALVMGVELQDCRKVAQLIGIKTFFNEFIAYEYLKNLISNGDVMETYSGNFTYRNDDIYLHDTNTTLIGGYMSDRSEVIATYALCGFANVGSIGIQLGGLGAMAINRKPAMAQVVVRAMIAGNVACFLTACIAGLFYQG